MEQKGRANRQVHIWKTVSRPFLLGKKVSKGNTEYPLSPAGRVDGAMKVS